LYEGTSSILGAAGALWNSWVLYVGGQDVQTWR